MKDENKLYRRWWFESWQCRQAEAWLSGLAQQGWQLESIGERRAVFTQCEPAVLEYSCVFHRVKENVEVKEGEKDIFDIYKEAGWKYTGFHKNMLVFCAPNGAKPPDGYANSPAELLKLERRYFLMEALTSAVIMLIIPIITLYADKMGTLADVLLHSDIKLLIAIVYMLSSAAFFVRAVACLVRAKKRIDDSGETVQPGGESAYKKGIAWKIAERCIGVSLAFFLIFSDFLYWPGNNPQLPQEPLAVISVSDIAGAGNSDSTGKANYYSVKHDLLYPKQVESIENANLKMETAHPEERAVTLYVEAYHALTPWLACLLADQFAKDRGSDGFFSGQLAACKDAMGFDRLWARSGQAGERSVLLAVQGSDVYRMSYDGNATVGALASALKDRLTDGK
jgi:hypothetical protein